MTTINLKDNNCGNPYHITENVKDCLPLQNIANRKMSELSASGNGLVIYPPKSKNKDYGIDDEYILTTRTKSDSDGRCISMDIETGNVAGFISIGNLRVNISSRFSDNTAGEDFFLHYMLEKTLGLNVVNMMHGTQDDPAFNFLLYLFPKLLNDALAQGIYKEYIRNEYNDANVRGTIDISRHIRTNIPFGGRIAYRTREFSHDNHVTQLVRHTIEYIRTMHTGRYVLENDADTRAGVSQIITATPKYSRKEREKVIKNNLRPVQHPYFTEYAELQRLCLRILKHEKIKYGASDNEICGILFDVSILWEEYLSTVITRLGFEHLNNRTKTKKIYLANGNKFPRYPDFYEKTDERIVIDAKYKNKVDERDDVNQMVTYMYMLKSCGGILVKPCTMQRSDETYSLKGYGEDCKATLCIHHFDIPQGVSNYNTFKEQMKKSEERLEEYIMRMRAECTHQ